jgi:outer membrane lipopolysaccharide assembly protein LptE/RlpB
MRFSMDSPVSISRFPFVRYPFLSYVMRLSSRVSRLASAALLLTFLTGCGYHLAGGNGTLPSSMRTIAIPTVANRSFEPSIEGIVTHEIREAFIRNSRLRVMQSTDESDLALKGTILSFELIPISFDRERNIALEYRIKLDLEFQLEDTTDGKVLWTDPMQEGTAEFSVTVDTTSTRVAEDRAIREASRNLAENMVHRVLEGTVQ